SLGKERIIEVRNTRYKAKEGRGRESFAHKPDRRFLVTEARFIGHVSAECRVNGRGPKSSSRLLERVYTTRKWRFETVERIRREQEVAAMNADFQFVCSEPLAAEQILVESEVVPVAGIGPSHVEAEARRVQPIAYQIVVRCR